MIRIKELREEKDMLQDELAEAIGMTRQGVSAYETGIREPNIEKLIQIADIFDVSIDYLVGRTNKR